MIKQRFTTDELRAKIASHDYGAELCLQHAIANIEALELEVQALRKDAEQWRKHCDTLTHQVICCGVAASHPDATLTTRGAYAGKWNSAQAEEVRKLRADRDRLRYGA